MRRIVLLLLIPAPTLIIYFLITQKPSQPFLSPSSSSTVFTAHSTRPLQKHYGFLPYWLLSTNPTALIPPNLTDVAYFSLSLDPTGQLVTSDTAYRRFVSFRQSLPQQYNFHITLTPSSSQALENILTNSSTQLQVIETVRQIALTYEPDGINIDFEPTQATPQHAQSFNMFITGLIQTFTTMSSPPELTIDVYANAAAIQNLWDIPYLASQPLKLVVMGYDYHRQSSDLAGPIGPIHNTNGESISSHLSTFLKHVKPSNLILGIPLYGYQWHITDPESKHTYPKSAKAIYLKDIPSLLTRFNAQTVWDSTSLSPYALFTTDDKEYYVAYESTQSLTYKKQLAESLQLDGVAYWALGYLQATHPFWSN